MLKRLPLILLGLAAAAPAVAQVRLTGAGATFPAVIYQDWILAYNKAHAGTELKGLE